MKPSNDDIAKTLGLNRPVLSGKKVRWLFSITVIVLITAAIIVASTKGKSSTTQYTTEKVRRGDITVNITATGTLEPTNTVSVGSEISGIVVNVNADYNDRVQVNEVLARIDTSKLEAQVTQSKAALESAQAKVLQADATVVEAAAKLAKLKKVHELSNGKVPAQTEMDVADATMKRAEADAASARADVYQAQANLQYNETDIRKSIIRSPINGVVLFRKIDPGQTVAATFETPVLFTLAEDLTQMQLHVDVDEADVGKVQKGQQATFRVSAYPNHSFQAQIIQARYGATTTSGVVTYETILTVDNRDLLLRPGMTATADIVVKDLKNVLLMPSTALRFSPPVEQESKSSGDLLQSLLPRPPRGSSQQNRDTTSDTGQHRIWILKNNVLSPVSITTGEASGGLTEVVSGDIEPGMDVVTDYVESGT